MKTTGKYIFGAFLLLIFSGIVNSCIIVKYEDTDDTPLIVRLSPKPEIEMSDQLVRSDKGDMVALLPKGWNLVDVESEMSSDVFAVAVNSDYSLCAVFSNIRKTQRVDSIVAREGLLGLARHRLRYHENKTAGAVKQIGKFASISMGNQNFMKYIFSNTEGANTAQTLVFKSTPRSMYFEFSLLPMNVTGKPMPAKAEVDKIFNSIMATIQY